MNRALSNVCAVGFASTKPGTVSSAKRGWEEEPGKVFPREETCKPDLERGLPGDKGGKSPGRGKSMHRSMSYAVASSVWKAQLGLTREQEPQECGQEVRSER